MLIKVLVRVAGDNDLFGREEEQDAIPADPTKGDDTGNWNALGFLFTTVARTIATTLSIFLTKVYSVEKKPSDLRSNG